MSPGERLDRLSLNTATVRGGTILDAVEACVRAGVPWIAPWRHDFDDVPLERAARAIRDAGLRVSSLCRGGFFPAADAEARERRVDDNRRAVDEAAALGSDVLVLVCGGLPNGPNGRDLGAARRMVADGIAALAPYAEERGVRLGIEPLHPMFAADRSVVVTLEQATALARGTGAPNVGVVIDVYHVWWDPNLDRAIRGAEGRILGFHVDDWIVPLPDVLAGRGMMGDGVIELRSLRRAVDAAGYDGPIEVEIFNEEIWAEPLDVVVGTMVDRYRATVLD